MAGMTYRAAAEPQKIVDRVIAKSHPHLMEVKVLCLFRSKHKRKGGKQTWADARKVGGLMAYLADGELSEAEIDPNDVAFFLIEFAEDLWPRFTDAQKEALCDHELCVVGDTRVAGPAVLNAHSRWHTGKIIHIRTASGLFLSCTPNHPVLTDRGWVLAAFLNEGDHVVKCGDAERVSGSMDPNECQMPTPIEQIAGTGDVILRPVPESSEDFDSHVTYRQVDAVTADGMLLSGGVATLAKPIKKQEFSGGDGSEVRLSRLGVLLHRLFGVVGAAPLGLGKFQIGVRRAVPEKPVFLRFRETAHRDTLFLQGPFKDVAAQPQALLKRIQGFSADVAFDEIIDVVNEPFSGHVYNLETVEGWYSANGIVTHNCHLVVEQAEDGGITLKTRSHDLEEFRSIVERHGMWAPDVEMFAQVAARSLQLSLMEDA